MPQHRYPASKMLGKKFGKRTVLRQIERYGRPDHYECQCACGKISVIHGASLRAGKNQSCLQCRKHAYGGVKYNLKGRRYGLWTVTEFAGYGPSQSRMWKCRCACGFETVFSSGYIGTMCSLGCRACRHKRMLRVANTAMWMRVKVAARKRGYTFALDKDTTFRLLEEQKYRCALTGLPIKIATGRAAHMRGGSTASLDRIDNTLGYLPGNVWWVHKDVNRMKWILPLERFVEICQLVARRRRRGKV